MIQHSRYLFDYIFIGYLLQIDGVDIRNLTERQITSLTRSKRLLVCVRRLVQDDGKCQYFCPSQTNTFVSHKYQNSVHSQ